MHSLLKNKEISIVVIVLLVLCMMIIPLPHIVMDSIIAFNLGITIIVLMVVIYMKSTLSLTSFPSILLVLSLLRIGITVSTSRLILLEGSAGEIINTFGKFVAGGNLVVGIIIFTIITIINFIVITKGSERVAEVAARFTLDAMPGKQMSIDADVRSGAMTNEQAKEGRHVLVLESRLYGAMDGSMKFIKGDAIASIVDIVINLLGGIIIGVLQNGMPLGDALHKYTVLTIGDGLVQQIPALIISLTAGLLITRVEGDSESSNLGQNIINQLFDSYKALFAASSVFFCLAIIPGMPSFIFLLLFSITFFAAYKGYRTMRNGVSRQKNTENSLVLEEESNDNKNLSQMDNVDNKALRQLVPLILLVSSTIKNSDKVMQLKGILNSLQQEIMLDLGVSIPQVIIRYSDTFDETQVQILVHEIPTTTATIYWDHLLVIETNSGILSVLDDSGGFQNQMFFGNKNMGVWYNGGNKKTCDDFQISYHSIDTVLMLYFKYELKQHLHDFIGIQEVKRILDSMTDYLDLIRELLKLMPLNKVTEVAQRLVREDISIRNFKVILDNLLEYAPREKEVIIINEYIRKGLGRYISYKFSGGTYIINSIYLSVDLENIIRQSIRYNSNGSYLSIDPQVCQQMIQEIKEIESQIVTPLEYFIITSFDIRRYVKVIVEKSFRYLRVLSFQELEDYAEYNVLGIISVNANSNIYDTTDNNVF